MEWLEQICILEISAWGQRISPFGGCFGGWKVCQEVSKWEVVRAVAEGKERILRKGNGQGYTDRSERSVRQRVKDENSVSDFTWLNPEGCRGWSEVLLAMFWGWENAGRIWMEKWIRAIALRKNTCFSTGRKYRRRPLIALVHGNRKGTCFWLQAWPEGYTYFQSSEGVFCTTYLQSDGEDRLFWWDRSIPAPLRSDRLLQVLQKFWKAWLR